MEPRFEAGAFLDGSVALKGVFIGTDGWVRLEPEQARQLQDFLNRALPRPALAEQRSRYGVLGGGIACAQAAIAGQNAAAGFRALDEVSGY